MTASSAEALAQIQATLERMQALNSRLSKQVADSRREQAEFGEKMAKKRRSGEQGRAWQVLQQRIDMRQTTEQDIFAGIDKSTEAREVRAQLTANLTQMRSELETLREEDPELAEATKRQQAGLNQMTTQYRRFVDPE